MEKWRLFRSKMPHIRHRALHFSTRRGTAVEKWRAGRSPCGPIPVRLPYAWSVVEQPSRQWSERYELLDLVMETDSWNLWKAYDNRLRRTVGLRIFDSKDPRAEALQQGGIAAAHITDRRFINVLDVMGPDPDDELVIITEWLPAMALSEVLNDPMTPHGAATMVSQAASAIAAAHAQGVYHGHLRPASLMLLPDGSLRLRGHGIDAGLYGRDPDLEPTAADIHGLGSLLYCCLTARWPFPRDTGLPVAPQANGKPIAPEQIVADVPSGLSRIIERCWRGDYRTADEMATDLREQIDELWTGPRPGVLSTRRRRVATAGVVGGVFGAAVLMGLADAANRPGDPVTAQTLSRGVAALVPSVGQDERRLPIVRVKDYDPYGVDGESPELRRNAIDRDPLTAWTTVTYTDPYLGGKPGVGLMFDLGAPRPVTSVDLKLVGANSDLRVLVGNKKYDDVERYRQFAEVTGAGSRILLRTARPMTGRYVVVWFTRLPWIEGGYRGGVRSLVVRSG